jgi:hypothetical protein
MKIVWKNNKKLWATCSTIFIVIFFGKLCFAAESVSVRSYAIPLHGKLELKSPSKWKSGFGQPPDNLPPTIAIGPANKEIYSKITVFWNHANKPNFNDPKELKANVYRLGKGMLSGSVESTIILKEIAGIRTKGYYYTITDKNPKPGDWKYMSQGSVSVKDLQLAFTILSHKKSSSDIDAVIKMLKEAEVK